MVRVTKVALGKGIISTLFKFIKTNLKYPKEALENKIEGDVEVGYDVDGNGKVRNIKILDSLGHGCDQEVMRLVGLLKYEKAYNKGRNVTLHRKLKVNFKLPEPKPAAKQKINYLLVKDKTKEKAAEPKKGQTINYTIKF